MTNGKRTKSTIRVCVLVVIAVLLGVASVRWYRLSGDNALTMAQADPSQYPSVSAANIGDLFSRGGR
jgi:hypothetical protein